jgi:hypothetical protein
MAEEWVYPCGFVNDAAAKRMAQEIEEQSTQRHWGD